MQTVSQLHQRRLLDSFGRITSATYTSSEECDAAIAHWIEACSAVFGFVPTFFVAYYDGLPVGTASGAIVNRPGSRAIDFLKMHEFQAFGSIATETTVFIPVVSWTRDPLRAISAPPTDAWQGKAFLLLESPAAAFWRKLEVSHGQIRVVGDPIQHLNPCLCHGKLRN